MGYKAFVKDIEIKIFVQYKLIIKYKRRIFRNKKMLFKRKFYVRFKIKVVIFLPERRVIFFTKSFFKGS